MSLSDSTTLSRRSIPLYVHEKQGEVLNTRTRFKVVVAGRRWGKTQLAKVAIIRKARRPRSLIWYVAPTYRMAKGIMWAELINSIPKRWIRKVNDTLMTIVLVNHTRIELKGADKPDTLRGVGLDFLVIDEAQDMKKETWVQVLRPTLASTGGQAMIIGTPKAFNWLYDEYVRGQDATLTAKGEWASWQFPTITSPFIPLAEIEAAKADMDEKSFRQEFEASFETMSGRVYYAFNRAKHLGQFPFNPRLPIWVGMDFNVDPMSAVILQPQDNGELWAVDEIVIFGSNTAEMADELERKYWRFSKQITIFPDPAGAYRSTKGRGESDLDILREKGFKRIKHRRKHPAIADRVNAVNRMLESADGRTRFRINRTLKHLVESFDQTIYKVGSRDIDKTVGMEHSTDAAGYPIELQFPLRKFTPMGVSL